MSSIEFRITGAKDDESRILMPPRIQDPLRHKPVWAVYKVPRGAPPIGTRHSALSDLATAKAAADALNAERGGAGSSHYFKVFRAIPE
jgi:hypothetical protein